MVNVYLMREERECNKKFFLFLHVSYSAHLAEELNLLDLAPLLHDDFLWLKAKKIPLYLYSTTAVSALSMAEFFGR